MNIEQLAIDAGVIYVAEDYTYWTENNAIEVLDKFAQMVIQAHMEHTIRCNNCMTDFKGNDYLVRDIDVTTGEIVYLCPHCLTDEYLMDIGDSK
jgi:hypothetical protein